MPIKDIEKRKAYHKKYILKHYQNNKEYYQEKRDKRKAELKEFIRKFKDVPCMDCDIKYPHYVMDFDHKENKIFNLGKGHNKGINQVIKEIAKCDVVCSNCHRIRTWKKYWPSSSIG